MSTTHCKVLFALCVVLIAFVLSIGTALAYSATFYQSGISAGTLWGVTVNTTRYTSTGSSVTANGLTGTVSYSYDSSVSGGSGTRYSCNIGCTGSVSSSVSTYRKPITISNTGSALTNYQVSITVDTASLISAGKMRNDCGDVRFTDSDGSTQLNYWIESGCNSASTKLWVRVPSVPAGSKTIYVYYGNTTATSTSNGNNVFLFFDDFESASIDTAKWSVSGSGVTQTGGYLYASTNGEQWKRVKSIPSFGANNVLEYSISITGDVGGQGTGYHGFYDGSAGEPPGTSCCYPGWSTALTPSIKHIGFGEGWCSDWGMCSEQANGASREGGYIGATLNNAWDTVQVKWYGSGSYLYAKRSDGWTYSTTLSSYPPTGTSLNIFFGVNDNTGGYGPITMYVYWVRVRNYAAVEPTTSVGAEESSTTTTATYITQYQLTLLSNPSSGGTTSPVSGSYWNAGQIIQVSAVPAGNYSFVSWSGSGSGSYSGTANPATVTMNSPIAQTANFVSIIKSFQIYPGWNLVSFPYTDLVAFNNNCKASDLTFYTWDSVSKWQTVRIESLQGGKGYWMYNTNPNCQINYAGLTNITSSSTALRAGWNMAGGNGWNINSVKGTCNVLSAIYWDPSLQKWTNTNALDTGRGYWLQVSGNCNFS